MAKHKPDETEYLPEFDSGTYQTGAIKAPRPSSGLVAFLLLVVIFLGGLCSLLGLLNIRLLAQLAEQTGETVPIYVESQPATDDAVGILDQLEDPAPSVPADTDVELKTEDVPYYSPNKVNEAMTARQIYEQNAASIVEVQCLTHFGSTITGTGLVLSQDGFLLVNCHIVDAAKRIFVTFSDGSMLRASLVGSDSFSDLAVLYVQAQGLTPARFSNNKTLQVTDPTYAVEFGGNVGESMIFSTPRTFCTESHNLKLIQTCSGGEAGPVFNSFGYVIGFQVSSISQYFGRESSKGVGLVVPSSTIHQITQALLADGEIAGRPSIGVEVEAISKLYQQYWQLPDGLLLTEVEENSSAAACGLQKGDILLALDGQPMSSRSDLYTALYGHNVGDTVIAVVCRDDQKFTVKLKIEDSDDH